MNLINKEEKMGRECSTNCGDEESSCLSFEHLQGVDHYPDQSVDERRVLVLKWALRENDVGGVLWIKLA